VSRPGVETPNLLGNLLRALSANGGKQAVREGLI
jgi:hypothetical protein